MKLKNLDHISVVVSDMAKAKEFFTGFGFKIDDEANLQGDWISSVVGLKNVEARYVRLSLPGSGTSVELMEHLSPPTERTQAVERPNQVGYRHIALEVQDIEAAVEELESRGVVLVGPVQTYEETGKKLVYFYGPDGILLELAEYRRR